MSKAKPFLLCAVLLFSFLAIPLFPSQADDVSYKTENVFIVFIDGARYTETFGDANHTHIPYIWNHLRPNGTIDTSFYNRGDTNSVSGHASAMTGIWQSLPNDGSKRPANRTIFELYRKQTDTPKDKVWVIAGKNKLDVTAYSDDPEYGQQYAASFDATSPGYGDSATWAKVQQVMDEKHPSLMMINLAEVDDAGHDGVWRDYVDAIEDADEIVYMLWEKLQADPVYRGKTTMIVTNDHGRHTNGTSDGWEGHGCDCDGCQHLMFLALGPDIRENVVIDTDYELIDIMPTVGVLLGLEMPIVQGKVMQDMLTNAQLTGNEAQETPFISAPVTIMVVMFVGMAVIVRRRKN